MKRRLLALLVLTLGFGVSPVATAAPAPAAPSRYQQLWSELFTAPAHGQGAGMLACPQGTRVVGGGVFTNTPGLDQSTNASYPDADGRAWIGRLNNDRATDSQVRIVLVCLAGVRDYSVVRGRPVTEPPGADATTTTSAACPAGTVVLAGGASAGSDAPRLALAASRPVEESGWQAAYNNHSNVSARAVSFAVCGHRPKGYAIVVGSAQQAPPRQLGFSDAVCDPDQVVLGGGGSVIGPPSRLVDIESIYPESRFEAQTQFDNHARRTLSIGSVNVCAAVG
jgi:hypothetical protein